jgi:hypothetical protein
MFNQLRNEYQSQLKRDPEKEFSQEFVRTTDLERRLIDEHGFEAIRLIFDDHSSALYSVGELPDQCPWARINSLDIPSAIEAVFSPIARKVPNLVNVLCERCSHLYTEQKDDGWLLHYFLDMFLYDGRRYYQVYTGGLPSPDPKPNPCMIEYDWSVPPDLARFYGVHDGFGPILASKDIAVMAKMMDPICKAQNFYPEGYQYSDLLEFHPDGAGNAQCVYRHQVNYTTVDWDHETWEITGSQDFFDYLDERLSQLDEE